MGTAGGFSPGVGPRAELLTHRAAALDCVSLGKGNIIYNSSFNLFKGIRHLYHLCKAIAKNSELVKPGGVQYLPSDE